MPADAAHLALLATLVLVAAALYSSVGHAGASGYLAAMALVGVAPAAMKPMALVMNVVVATVGTLRFASAGLIPRRLVVPLCVGSVPAAFAGGSVVLAAHVYQPLLGAILLVAAWRLWSPTHGDAREEPPAAPWLTGIGAGLGFLAGVTGVGGGIFLSPLVILAGWEEPRRAAGLSAVFILVNSLAGLLGHLSTGRHVPLATLPLALVALAGGLYGSWLGARRLPPLVLRRLLAAVLVVAGGKLVLAAVGS